MKLFKKTSYISGGNFPNSKNKKSHSEKFLILWEIELSNFNGTQKSFSYISGGNLQSLKNKHFLCFRKNISDVRTAVRKNHFEVDTTASYQEN